MRPILILCHFICSQLLNQLNANALAALLEEYGATVNTLDQLLENYIMNSTYDIVFFKVTLFMKQQDWDLAEAIRELRVRKSSAILNIHELFSSESDRANDNMIFTFFFRI